MAKQEIISSALDDFTDFQHVSRFARFLRAKVVFCLLVLSRFNPDRAILIFADWYLSSVYI
ncbi:uncharacterized protein METZ01_LOCUS202719 [marine metagenome]|uniref:Uncharacterized protein n=1 Tax=marine metagenome TaxID=408172 RepID=A0A382EHB0_9ZZZZ